MCADRQPGCSYWQQSQLPRSVISRNALPGQVVTGLSFHEFLYYGDLDCSSLLVSKEDAIKLTRYNRRAFEAYERGIKRLGWAEATKDRGIGHLSYKDTLVHILNVHEAWLVAAAQDRWEVGKDPSRRRENVKSWLDLRRYRERVWANIDVLIDGMTDRDLKRRVRVPWMSGRYTLGDAFFQSSFEQAHHLGEIIGAYWQVGKIPPQMMWIPTLLGTRVSVA